MLLDRTTAEKTLLEPLATINPHADLTLEAKQAAHRIAAALALPEAEEATRSAIAETLRGLRRDSSVPADELLRLRRSVVMTCLAYHGWLDTTWRPIHEWLSTSQNGSGGSIWLREHQDQLITLKYLDHERQLQTVQLTLRYKLDDDGDWVGQANDDQWVVIGYSWVATCAIWALSFTPDRPPQWFEGLLAGRSSTTR